MRNRRNINRRNTLSSRDTDETYYYIELNENDNYSIVKNNLF